MWCFNSVARGGAGITNGTGAQTEKIRRSKISACQVRSGWRRVESIKARLGHAGTSGANTGFHANPSLHCRALETVEAWTGAMPVLAKALERVTTEMSLHVHM